MKVLSVSVLKDYRVKNIKPLELEFSTTQQTQKRWNANDLFKWCNHGPDIFPINIVNLCVPGMLLHAYPATRNLIAEKIFVAKGVWKSVNWGKAKKVDVEGVRRQLECAA